MSASQIPQQWQTPRAGSNECPPWCQREHLGDTDDPSGFHHDGEVVAIPLEDALVDGRPEYLYVNVSQREHHSQLDEPALVEVQNDRMTLALLTPEECARFSQALLERAALIERNRDSRGEGSECAAPTEAASDAELVPWSPGWVLDLWSRWLTTGYPS